MGVLGVYHMDTGFLPKREGGGGKGEGNKGEREEERKGQLPIISKLTSHS